MNEKIKEIKDLLLSKKFNATKNGYDPKEVDVFLDAIISYLLEINKTLEALQDNSDSLEVLARNQSANIETLKKDLLTLKSKYKFIKETDFIDNNSSIELLRKVNKYEKILHDNGIDID